MMMKRRLTILLILIASTSVISLPNWIRTTISKITTTIGKKRKNNNMGGTQVGRIMTYDRAGNKSNALTALDLFGSKLKWFRLDDGVMGGRSETTHKIMNDDDGTLLDFTGTINTDVGGFCSIRTSLSDDDNDDNKINWGFSPNAIGIKLKIIGDGKTYKFIMSDGNTGGGPFSRSPSWRCDIPTKDDNIEQDIYIPFTQLNPACGGRPSNNPSAKEISNYKFDATTIREIGLMLSLRLSDGSPNPKETFGEGIFPFSLKVSSIKEVTTATTTTTEQE
jgi:hypothetical protein